MTNGSTGKTIGRGNRPIFIPKEDDPGVIEKEINFDWHMGMSREVRVRSIESLHKEAKNIGYSNVLEVSSKSQNRLGNVLSAFFLKNEEGIAVENLFQSSKVFENNQQFLDLIKVTAREAKTDKRLQESGRLIKFHFEERDFSLEPKSIFYDWLYIKTLEETQNVDKKAQLIEHDFIAFSDIEFNPKKSFNCQARTLALYVSLVKNECINEFISDPEGLDKKYNFYKKDKPLTDVTKGQQPDLFNV